MLHANLPTRFWDECILTATLLINKLPFATLQWKSPFKVLFNKPPSFDHLRTIGCLTYATIIGPQKSHDKLAHSGRKSILIGYPPNQKGYKLYDLEKHELFLSRNVTFF